MAPERRDGWPERPLVPFTPGGDDTPIRYITGAARSVAVLSAATGVPPEGIGHFVHLVEFVGEVEGWQVITCCAECAARIGTLLRALADAYDRQYRAAEN